MDRATGKQVRDRYMQHLAPKIKKGRWSAEEDTILKEAHEQYGNRWTAIAKLISGRTDNDVKNRWHSNRRRNERARQRQNQEKLEPPQSKETTRSADSETRIKNSDSVFSTEGNTISRSSATSHVQINTCDALQGHCDLFLDSFDLIENLPDDLDCDIDMAIDLIRD